MKRLNELAGRLPFHVDDSDSVNEVFFRWHSEREEADLRTLEIWSYCRTQLYVLNKLSRDSQAAPNDFDLLSSALFTKIRMGMESVREPARFVNWVNVVSRNTYLNERRKVRPQSELNEDVLAGDAPPTLIDMDRAEVIRVIQRAVGRLPPSLTAVGKMKLLESKNFKQIAETTGLPLATVRTYTTKIYARLRRDPEILEIARDVFPDLFGRLKAPDDDSQEE